MQAGARERQTCLLASEVPMSGLADAQRAQCQRQCLNGARVLVAGKANRLVLKTDSPDETKALDATVSLIRVHFGKRGGDAKRQSSDHRRSAYQSEGRYQRLMTL